MGSQGVNTSDHDDSDAVPQRRKDSSPPNTNKMPDPVRPANSAQVSEPSASQHRAPSVSPTPQIGSSELSSTITRDAAAQPVIAKDTIKQLENINAALSKFGTSMEEVLKLDAAGATSDGNESVAKGTEVGQDGTVSGGLDDPSPERGIIDKVTRY